MKLDVACNVSVHIFNYFFQIKSVNNYFQHLGYKDGHSVTIYKCKGNFYTFWSNNYTIKRLFIDVRETFTLSDWTIIR